MQRVPLPDCPLYVPDGASKPLAASKWGSVISLVDGAAMQIPIEELHEPTVKWLRKMNPGWSVEELKTTMGLSSSPLPPTPKEGNNSKVTLEKEEGMSDTRSSSDNEDAVCTEAGYEADVNIHQRVGPKKKSWDKLTEEPQPPTCSYQEYDDLAEVPMCEVELDNLHKEKLIELLALKSLVQHIVEVCTDKENGNKAMPCGWPCSQKDAETSKQILEEKIFQLGEKEQERMFKEKWETHYHGLCSREEELQAFYMSQLSEEELLPGEESDEEEDNDYYVDLTGLIMDLQAAERQECGKSNLKSDDGFDEALKKHPAELQGLTRKHNVVLDPLLSPGSCKKLIQIDLEVTNEHKNSTLRSRPIPLNEEDEKKTMRQIYECCDAKLMSRCEGKEFRKHC